MLGTTWIDRISHTLAAVDSAFKAKPPSAAELYPPGAGASVPTFPIVFPGWDRLWSDNAQGNRKDETNARTAITSPWVFSDIQAIANEISAANLIIKERKGTKLEDIENHPLELLWEAPNEHMGRSYLMSFWAWSYTLASKAYLYWMPDRTGALTEVWPIPPFMIQPIPSADNFIEGYAFRSQPQSKPIMIPREYITYSHSVNIFDIRDGLSFLAAALLGIKSDLAAEQWNLNNFGENNAVPDGMIAVPRDTLDQDLERIRMEIRAFFGGTRRGVAIARAGDLDYKPFGRSQKEMEFIQLRQFSQKEIDRTLGFPEGYWSERANRANAEQARATMISGAVWPLLVRLAEDMNAQTIPRWWGKEYRAEFSDIRPEDRDLKLKELQFYATIETLDELRQRIGDKPIGDVRGLMLLKELDKGAAMPTSVPSDAVEEELAAREAEVIEEAPVTEEGADEAAMLEEEGTPPLEEPLVEETAEDVKAAVKHMPGQHDQRSHGVSRGGGSRGVSSKVLPESHPVLKRFGHDTGEYREFTDPSSADRVMTDVYTPWAASLSDDERDAVRGYQQQTFDGINGTLRGHRLGDEKTPYYQDQIKLLDTALDSGEVPYNVISYRGMVHPGLSVGDIFIDDGFTSTTLAPSIARARAQQLGDRGVVARIRVPQGTKGAYVETVTSIDQAELLLHRGTRYRVTEVTPTSIGLEVVD